MTMRFWQISTLALGLAGLAAGPLFGSPINFNFGGTDQALASTVSYTAGGYTITASGYMGSSSKDLYQKDDGASEDGLGLDKGGSWDHEINPQVGTTAAQAIIFNVSNLVTAGISEGTFELGSLQVHSATDTEAAKACVLSSGTPNYSPSSGCISGLTQTNDSVGSVTLNWGNNDFVEFITDPHQTDPTGNYLVDSLEVSTGSEQTPTPEPASLILFGTALLGLALVGRRHLAGLLG